MGYKLTFHPCIRYAISNFFVKVWQTLPTHSRCWANIGFRFHEDEAPNACFKTRLKKLGNHCPKDEEQRALRNVRDNGVFNLSGNAISTYLVLSYAAKVSPQTQKIK